jgi:pimeloyl-ACP methyl ester carboxylesterase
MTVASALAAILVAGILMAGSAWAGFAKAESISGPAGKLYVDDGGSGGVPVVFIHSFAGDRTHWQEQLAHLRKTRRAVALDLRGHGQSEAPKNGDYSVEALTADVAAVVDALKLGRLVLVGHSMGGSAAIAYAAQRPEKVAGLVLVESAAKTPPEMGKKVIADLEADFDNVYGGYWKKLLKDARPEVAAQVGKGMKAMPRETA